MQAPSTNHTIRSRVGLVTAAMTDPQQQLLATLERLFAVEFIKSDSHGLAHLDAVIAFGCSQGDYQKAWSSGLPVLAFDQPPDAACCSTDSLLFRNNAETPRLLRGRSFRGAAPRTINGVRPTHDDTVLATMGDLPIWTSRTSRTGRSFRCGMPFPTLEPAEGLCDYLHEERFPYIVPVIEVLRDITGEQSRHVPIRAALMFDDPNLHWPSYGCLDFQKLAASGATHRYHTAIATVPIDNWYCHPAAARTFAQNRDRMSLLVHGNNHTYAELLGQRNKAECASYLRQALRRVQHLERRSGVPVSRVMAAPHGACGEEMLSAMVDTGFEAAVISATSLRYYNSTCSWVRALGIAVTEYIGGLPVIPRFRISSACQARILHSQRLS